MLKRILLAGWTLLVLGVFLVIEFPGAAWNRVASLLVWLLSIGMFFVTLAFCVLVAVRLVSRMVRRPAQLPFSEAQQLTTASQPSHKLVIGLRVILAMAAFVALLLMYIEHEIRSSAVYQTSVATAQASPEVLGMLGRPVKAGWFVSGQITESTDGGGHATLRIPLKGPKGSGTLSVEAGRQAGNWQFAILRLAPVGRNSTVDLLNEQPK